uniref:Gfo/Idh/MocA family oxidoreductase n=1 Tax=Desulfomonile tiedjei TaxID=2358 RepID=A0A7C4ARS6_9BACT
MESPRSNIQVGVVGVGSMGQHHARVLSEMPRVDFVGVYDPDHGRAAEICGRFGGRAFASLEDLLGHVEALTIAAPTTLHAELAIKCLEKNCHVLVEKPLAHSVRSAEALVEAANARGKTLMVGHIERYNPAVQALLEHLACVAEPVLAVDARRLSPFDGSRCLDVDVLHDLLVHDLDLALEIANSDIVQISAVGRSVFSDKLDMSHVRILFANKTWASFTTAKCSPKKTRSLTVCTPSRVLEADTIARSLVIHTAHELPDLRSRSCFMADIQSQNVAVEDKEPLQVELEDFVSAILDARPPIVDAARGLKVLKALEAIADVIRG